MNRRAVAARAVLSVALWTVLPSAAWAQSTISGLVTDTSGAVLPGVTVEASSPALIEKTRTAGTDAQGRYSIVDLRPGVYEVTFILSGFASVRRAGIEVTTNTNVPLNAELKVGAVEETVTVSGQSAVVDVQAAARTQVLSREVLDVLPNSRTYGTAGSIVPGVKLTKPDLGGTTAVQQAYVLGRGFTAQDDNAMQVDGLNVHVNNGGQAAYTNFGMVQEVNYQTSAITADTQEGGIRINMIPKDGGNTFHGNTFLGGSSGNWQANNITQDLKNRGLPSPTAVDHLYDVNPAVGGPLLRDRVWFWGSFRRLELSDKPGGQYPDGSPAIGDQWINSVSARITWQVNAKNKIALYQDRAYKQRNHDFTDFVPVEVAPQGIDPVTAASRRFPKVYYNAYGKWTSTLSNKLLLEGGLSMNLNNYSIVYQPGVAAPAGSANFLLNAPRVDIVQNTLTGASAFIPQTIKEGAYTVQAAMTYATGSHNFKTGAQYRFGPFGQKVDLTNGAMVERFRNGVADSVDVYDTPVDVEARLDADVGVYAQDGWTFKRLTLNPGVRFDYFKVTNEATAAAPGRFVPARQFDGLVANLPVWSNVVPRFGAVYDLRGDAKTALKFSASKYMAWRATDLATRYNPLLQVSDRRNWFDCNLMPGTSNCSTQALPTNGDGIAQSNEIGPSSNANFGVSAGRRPDPNLQRAFNVEYTASVQHQLLPGVSVNGAWYRRRFANVEGQFNALVNPASDYTAFQTTNPLTGAAMTVFNLNPAKLGQVDTVDRTSSVNKTLYSAYELSFSARLPRGGTALGGWTMERTTRVTCDASSPNSFIFCDQTGALHQDLGAVPAPPFRHELKLAGSYPLPWDTQISVSLLSFPGAAIQPTWSPAASIFPNGQRTSPVTVPLVASGVLFLDRWNQFDIGGRRSFHVGGSELIGQVDVFNLFNTNVVLGEILTYGTTLYRPTSILQGRLLRLSATLKF
jgi:carboxypeptidase family protein